MARKMASRIPPGYIVPCLVTGLGLWVSGVLEGHGRDPLGVLGGPWAPFGAPQGSPWESLGVLGDPWGVLRIVLGPSLCAFFLWVAAFAYSDPFAIVLGSAA